MYCLSYNVPFTGSEQRGVACSLASHIQPSILRAGNEKPDYMQFSSVYILYGAVNTEADCTLLPSSI